MVRQRLLAILGVNVAVMDKIAKSATLTTYQSILANDSKKIPPGKPDGFFMWMWRKLRPNCR